MSMYMIDYVTLIRIRISYRTTYHPVGAEAISREHTNHLTKISTFFRSYIIHILGTLRLKIEGAIQVTLAMVWGMQRREVTTI